MNIPCFLEVPKVLMDRTTRALMYVWIEVENWVKLEEKLVTEPYVHHCVGIHGNIMPVIYEAINYI